jgi:hypothetical protein
LLHNLKRGGNKELILLKKAHSAKVVFTKHAPLFGKLRRGATCNRESMKEGKGR